MADKNKEFKAELRELIKKSREQVYNLSDDIRNDKIHINKALAIIKNETLFVKQILVDIKIEKL